MIHCTSSISLCSPGNYKSVDGSPGGFREKVKMDLSATGVVTGKHENREIGRDARIFLANSVKIFHNPLKSLDYYLGIYSFGVCSF